MEWTLATGLSLAVRLGARRFGPLLPAGFFCALLPHLLLGFSRWCFQIRGLIGRTGIFPPANTCRRWGAIARGYWYAPTLLWFSSSAPCLPDLLGGMIASLLLV